MSSRVLRGLFALGLLLGLSEAGCSCSEEDLQGVGSACAETSECLAELQCLDQICTEACPADGVVCTGRCCEADQVCGNDGQCAAPTCEDQGGVTCGSACCDSGQMCTNGQCVEACSGAMCGTACCDTGEVCLAGTTCCESGKACNGECCGDNEACNAGQCTSVCEDGTLVCGTDEVCCDAGDICRFGECVTPGSACVAGGCATRPDDVACPDGQICDVGLGACVPSPDREDCVYVPPIGVFEPAPLFTWGQRGTRTCTTAVDCQTAETCDAGTCQVTWPHVTPAADDLPDHYQSTSIPMVTDLDGDCIPEIVFNTFAQSNFTSDGVLRAIRGDNGAKVWTVSDDMYRTDSTANPAIGDVDGDGRPEVFIQLANNRIARIDADGTPRWISDAFAGPEGSGSIALAHLDDTGSAEIVFGAAVYDDTGRLVFEGTEGVGIAGQGPISCVADLDGDGRAELVAGRTVYEFVGDIAEGTFAGQPRVSAPDGVPDGYCGLADLDGDQSPEVVLVGSGTVYVLQGQTLALLAELAIPGGGNGGAPNLADFDGDGQPDIGTAGAQNYVVMRYDQQDGLQVLWQAPTEDDSSSRTGSSVFDFDGDGRAEVVYNDEEFLRIYPGLEPDCRMTPPGPACDGIMTDEEILFRDLNSSRTRTEYPVIADVDGDFKAEIVFATSNEANFLDPQFIGDAGIEVWADRLDNWVATRPVWNQHSYHVTNVGLEGELPRSEAPNWSTPANEPYNSYRRNVQGGREAFCAPDLVVRDLSQDTDGCPGLVVKVSLANEGCLGVGSGVSVALYDEQGNVLTVDQTTTAIGPGVVQELSLPVGLQAPFTVLLQAALDDDGTGQGSLNECREENNGTELVQMSCRIDF